MNVLPIYMLPVRSAFLLFILFSFVGWCAEVLYVGLFFEHKFVNRGFLQGPLCPIYGFGGVVILLLPQILYTTWVELFFASLVLCSLVEYFVSWILEKTFHTLWWDYSHYKVNINGRVCLLNSVLFGVMGMVGGHFIFPYAEYLVTFLSDLWIRIISDCIAAVLAVDVIFTTKRLVDFNATMARIKTFTESLVDHYGHEEWFHNESLLEMVNSVKSHIDTRKDKVSQKILGRIEKLLTIRQKNIEILLNRFPTMKSVAYKSELKLLKDKIKNKVNFNKK